MTLSSSKKNISIISGITSKQHGESHKKVCENKDFCNVLTPSEDPKILEFDQYQKSDKAPFIIYADLECLIEKINGCKNNPENSSTTKTSEHIPSAFSISPISSFKIVENTGEDRGAAHSICNVNIVYLKKIL